jgi:hypothetical protein
MLTYVSIRSQHTSQHTSAYVSIRQHTSAYVVHMTHMPLRRQERGGGGGVTLTRQAVGAQVVSLCVLANLIAYVSIRQHTSAYVSIRQHTSAYVSI